MDFPVCKGVIEPASQMQEFEPGSLNFGSISSEGLNCLTADVSPTVEQPVPQSTQQATEAKHCHNCGATETPRWRPAPGHPGESLCNARGLHLRTHGAQRDGASGSGLKVNLTISLQLQHAANLISKINQWSAARGISAPAQLSK
eukprot:jgi/Astpho2/7040/Aster-x1416